MMCDNTKGLTLVGKNGPIIHGVVLLYMYRVYVLWENVQGIRGLVIFIPQWETLDYTCSGQDKPGS
jgi:hypothetical protein